MQRLLLNDGEPESGHRVCRAKEKVILGIIFGGFCMISDMIGLQVETEDGEAFGTLKDVIETGANDVYVVETSSHEEVLIPAIKECILEVDIEAGRMVVHLLDGLL